MIPAEQAITSFETWIGVWFRGRSGPSSRGMVVNVGRWHRVGSVGNRIQTACGGGARAGEVWPTGGHRLEIARPSSPLDLPGDVCPRCIDRPVVEREIEVPSVWLDEIADRVADRLRPMTSAGEDKEEATRQALDRESGASR